MATSGETFTINPCPVCGESHTYDLADLDRGGLVVTKAYEGQLGLRLARSGPETVLVTCPVKGTTFQVTLERPSAGLDLGDIDLPKPERKP